MHVTVLSQVAHQHARKGDRPARQQCQQRTAIVISEKY
jgi:hypothetical protein